MTTAAPADPSRMRLLWLDLTRSCQLTCTHCYNDSGPGGNHGAMSREDWLGVLDQAADHGTTGVQLIGGEPTMHPHFAELVDHALDIGLAVEIFSNLVHVSERCWTLFQRERVSVATSYYSANAVEHDAVTGRTSHRRTRANIQRAVGLGVRLRVAVIGNDDARIQAAHRDLKALGVVRVGTDRVRPFGRGSVSGPPDMSSLCGGCGDGTASIGPDGTVSPCVFSTWIDIGNVRRTPLADILGGAPIAEATAGIRRAVRAARGCSPDNAPCSPDNAPPQTCGPDDNEECSPGTPPSTCNPRR